MPVITVRKRLPHPRERLFDLVADVESYPAFLPYWKDARIYDREEQAMLVEQVIGWRDLRWRFRTRETLERPGAIHVHTRDRPFRQLDLHWRFHPDGAAAATAVEFTARYELMRLPLRRLFDAALQVNFNRILAAFEHRALELDGGVPPTSVEVAASPAVRRAAARRRRRLEGG